MKVYAFAAYGIYPPEIALQEAVRTLNRAGFNNEEVCMVLSPSHSVATIVRDARILNTERECSKVSAQMIGWISEFGAVLIPTLGFFIRSKTFLDALVIEQDFPSLSSESKTLAGLGFSQNDATRLGHQLSAAGALVYVCCQEKARADWAIEVLRHTGALETTSLESASPAIQNLGSETAAEAAA